jgi:hypothetical protein
MRQLKESLKIFLHQPQCLLLHVVRPRHQVDVFRDVACNVESTPRVAIVRKCIVNEQPVLISSIVIVEIFDNVDNVVTTLRTTREENSGFNSRQSLRGFFFTTV